MILKNKKTGVQHVPDASLCPITGNLRFKINENVDHIPDYANTIAQCRLHLWCGVETQAKILSCLGCSVSLCHTWYGLFRKEPNLIGMKSKLEKNSKAIISEYLSE